MAGVSTKEIKNRIRSMENTKQITKAMEMVAASKLSRAQARVANSRPYFQILGETIAQIVKANKDFSSPYFVKKEWGKTLHIVIAGDRGLAGGYNSNVLKLAYATMQGEDAMVLPIGKKTVDFFRIREIPMLSTEYMEAEDISVGDCFTLAKDLCKRYVNGELRSVHITYTNFVSVLSQTPDTRQILPLLKENYASDMEAQGGVSQEILYEPGYEEAFAAIVPEYLGGILYGALCESRAAEQAARRTAMDSATSNAEEMIEDLSLKYNRARQAAITQEITEIVSGA